MNGPQHYREAERLAERVATSGHPGAADMVADARLAQVHATLALAAATACPPVDTEDWRHWREVTR